MTIELEDNAVEADAAVPALPLPRIPNWELWIVGGLLIYFLARLLYFAVNIAPEIPPDESTHLGIIRLYAEAPLFIEDSPTSYEFGLVTRQPALYYFGLGKLAMLNVFEMDDVLFLRLINVVLAMLTVFAGYRLATRLTKNPMVRILFLVMATNTLMFTFIGSAVSYDNLVNLLAVLSVASLVGFVATEKPSQLLLFLLWNFLGTLTKTTFLPLTLVLMALYLFDRRSKLREDALSVFKLVSAGSHRARLLVFVTLVALLGNFWLYGSNLVRFGKPVPGCSDVLDLEQCMENRIFARNWVVNGYRTDRLTFNQAMAETWKINHPGDRDHAVRLLQNERAYRQSRPKPLPRWDYIQMVWIQAMKPTIFGIQAHLSMLKDPWALLPYNLILFAAFVLWIRTSRWDGTENGWIYLAVVAICYFLILIGYVNYKFYVNSHAPFLGVQGRYLFPVLIPTLLIVAWSLLRAFRRITQVAIVVLVSAVFMLGDLPFFIRHASPNWFATPSPEEETVVRPSH
jgi:hypothetical protein